MTRSQNPEEGERPRQPEPQIVPARSRDGGHEEDRVRACSVVPKARPVMPGLDRQGETRLSPCAFQTGSERGRIGWEIKEDELQVGARGFEPPTSRTRTVRSSQAELRPENAWHRGILMAGEILSIAESPRNNEWMETTPGGDSSMGEIGQDGIRPTPWTFSRNKLGAKSVGHSPSQSGEPARPCRGIGQALAVSSRTSRLLLQSVSRFPRCRRDGAISSEEGDRRGIPKSAQHHRPGIRDVFQNCPPGDEPTLVLS